MSGFEIRDQMNDIDEAPGKVWFWELDEAVIAADRCIQCGTCVAVCPSDSIGIGDDGLPALVKMCTGCSLCWDYCPRGGLRHEATWKLTGSNGNGQAVRERYSARARPDVAGAQDGGVVSAVLVALLEAGELDGALLARESASEPWKGEAFLARTPAEVVECAGSFYNQTMALGHLDLGKLDLPPDPRIALVGTPCEVEGLRAMQARPWNWGSARPDAVVLTIALLCTKSFNYEKLMVGEIQRKRGIPLEEIGRVDVVRGKLIVQDHQRETLIEEPIRDFHGAALKGCDECTDFLGNAADLSVGSVGSADGWSSVLVRSAAGKHAIDRAGDRLELRELERPQALEKLDALDKKVAFEHLERPYDPDAPLFVDFAEHVDAYAGGDRAPVSRGR
ncbi:MAG TPA: Coenzyme F420 hydrogenase/dehydrogenase, beta subunit C-terminal domain [Actinomycetes bacterium]